jgi:hypothetical protein
MMAIDFDEANITLGKPRNMTDEQCMSVRAYHGVDSDGFPFFLTVWQPSKEDIEAIKAGHPIALKVLGNSFPPVALYTVDSNGEPNF